METCLSYGFELKCRLIKDGLTRMNLKFVFVLIISLFIISCVTVTENTEEDSGDPFELATGDISDRAVAKGIIDRADISASIDERKSDWVAPPRPSDAAQEYPDFRVSTDLVEYFNIIQTCNPNIIRTPQANITWRSSSVTPDQMRLDVTHYGTRRGFLPGGFASLGISRDSSAIFENVYLKDQDLIRNSTLPDLYVTWFDVSENVNSAKTTDNLIMVEGLEAGVNYRWRLVAQLDGQVVATPSQMITANVCVADLKDKE